MSMNPRQSSRIRFRRFREEWRKARVGLLGAKAEPAKKAGIGAETHRSLGTLYRELYRTLTGQRGTIAFALALLSFATILRFLPPAATKIVIDYVLGSKAPPVWLTARVTIPTKPESRLALLIAVVFTVTVIGTAVNVWSRWLATRTAKRVQMASRRRVFEHAERLPLHRIYQLKSGGATNLLREDADSVGDLIFNMLYNPWRALIQLLSGIVVLTWVDWRFLLGTIALLPALALTDRVWNRRLRSLYKAVRSQRQEIDGATAEVFGGMRVVRAFGRQRTEAARFTFESHLLGRREVFTWWWTRLVETIWEMIVPTASAALLLYGGYQVLHGVLTLGDLMMFMVYLAMLLEPAVVLANSVSQAQSGLASFDRVLDVLAEPREMADHPGTITVRKHACAGRVTIEDVSFRYPGTEKDVLRAIHLDIEPGEMIALVGRSGAGKTTLCNLIARFYDPTAGSVRLDGLDLRSIEVESYRRLLGIVEQDVFLFDGSVAANIGYASRKASRDEVVRAARIAHAEEFIDNLPEGYDTVIGERGVKLSGGQRQRLAIARAVLADPRVFILDEATSNLDTHSERLIQKGLESLLQGRTSFVIAHRLSTIQRADRIVVLDAGAIVEVGSHEELMEIDGPYRNMVELQRLEMVE